MKKTVLSFCMLLLMACTTEKFDPTEIWDNIHSLDERVTSLEQLCREMNTNIGSLQTIVSALEKQDYIKNVSPVSEDGAVIGYTITFAQSGTVTIYHGKDGEKGDKGDKGETGDKGDTGAVGPQGPQGEQGEKGEAGETPVIGVAKDTDGVYYWTLNGSWLVDESGNKIPTTGKDGADGVQGETGATGPQGATGATGPQGPQGEQGETGAAGPQGPQGEAGKDGITPQLKIEDGRWLVSYDNGQSWVDVGQATGDQGPQGPQGEQGIQGEAGKDGDSFFQSVTQDEENVYLTLADGTKFSVPKTPSAAAVLTLANTTGFTATFNGTVIRSSLDLKVTVYYSTTPDLTVYKNKGKASVTEFSGDSFTLKLSGLGAETTYYYFTEVISNGTVKYSTVNTFRTGKADSYVDWEEGDQVGGEI